MKAIESIVLPVITPFDSNGQLDEKMLREAIEFEISAQVNALFFLGSYGQGPVIKKLEQKVGRGIQAECIRLRGLKVKRYPRWETASINDEQRQELREAYKAAGVNVV